MLNCSCRFFCEYIVFSQQYSTTIKGFCGFRLPKLSQWGYSAACQQHKLTRCGFKIHTAGQFQQVFFPHANLLQKICSIPAPCKTFPKLCCCGVFFFRTLLQSLIILTPPAFYRPVVITGLTLAR